MKLPANWLFAAGVFLATPAAAADQFDLVCTAKKVTVRYRVDLEVSSYCQDKCTVVRKIAEVGPGILVLEDHPPAFRGDNEMRTRVNRATGEWTEFFDYGPGASRLISGACTPAPFSGFPATRF